jgi:outer membrane immunogenic protein
MPNASSITGCLLLTNRNWFRWRFYARVQSGLIAAVVIGFTSVASAADLPVKAPVYKAPVAAPAFSWAGFYIGASAGYGWSDADLNLASVGTAIPPFNVSFVDAGASAIPPVLATHPRGFVGGGQLGYNYQVNRLVWGYEADFSFADIRGSDTRRGTANLFPSPPLDITAVGEQKLNFLGTVRGKLGFTPLDSLLVYATGGLAYGHVESSTNISDVSSTFSTSPASGSASAVRAGWTAGGGIESVLAFAPRWSLKAEYLYYDLGNLSYALSPAAFISGGRTPVGAINTTATAHFQGSLVRVGLNYKIN